MRRQGPGFELIHTVAVRGVIRAGDLGRLGLTNSTIYRRCRASGPWQRILPGVVLLHTGTPTADQLVVAALVYGGQGAMLTGLEACRRHGIRRGVPEQTPDVHILIPHHRQLRATEYVRVERSRRMPRPVVRSGVVVAPPARACIDAARRIPAASQVTELLAEAVQRNLCSVSDLSTELARCGRRGSAVPRMVLADVGAGVRSTAERDARRIWRRSGTPEPWWNAKLHDTRGKVLAVVDAWWDDVGLACEIDSLAWHLSPKDYARTTERAARLAAAGVTVVPTLPTRLSRDPDGAARELAAAYRAASTTRALRYERSKRPDSATP